MDDGAVQPEPNDEALVAQVLDGEVEIFGILVRRYEQKLRRYGRRFMAGREDIEDIVQEVFLKAYENLRSFDIKRRFSPWIYRIAHNTFINEMRRASRHPTITLDTDILFPHKSMPSPADDHERTETKEMMQRGLDQLDFKYREPLILFYFEEMSYAAIAEVLRIPVSTVGVRISRARVALKRILNTG
ncbi:MAG: RNA polymerase sigma factor [Candidatus Kerfeldbacteria bacterium]